MSRIESPPAPPNSDIDAEAVVRFVLADNSMRRISAYVEQGRRYQGETEQALTTTLIALFRQWAGDPLGRPGLETINAIESELDLRRIPRPYDSIASEIEVIRSATSNHAARLGEDVLFERAAGLVMRYRAAQASAS